MYLLFFHGDLKILCLIESFISNQHRFFYFLLLNVSHKLNMRENEAQEISCGGFAICDLLLFWDTLMHLLLLFIYNN